MVLEFHEIPVCGGLECDEMAPTRGDPGDGDRGRLTDGVGDR